MDALPFYVEGCTDPLMPGRVAVHTGETPGATTVLATEQTDLLDMLGA